MNEKLSHRAAALPFRKTAAWCKKKMIKLAVKREKKSKVETDRNAPTSQARQG
jgi:hypothetical protein